MTTAGYFCLIWWFIGVIGTIRWWTKYDSITLNEFFLVVIFGIIGPFAFIVPWYRDHKNICIFKKRGK